MEDRGEESEGVKGLEVATRACGRGCGRGRGQWSAVGPAGSLGRL